MTESTNILKSTRGQPTRNGTQGLVLKRKCFTKCYTAPRNLNVYLALKMVQFWVFEMMVESSFP